MRSAAIAFLALISAVSVAADSGIATVSGDSGHRQWQFDVYLDDKRIGSHRFDVELAGDERILTSVADFKVKFLFVTAFSYEHRNTERWRDDCLVSLEAATKVNGKETQVRGKREDGSFTVQRGDEAKQLPACVMTFAYWNPDFLDEERLLNPQTGEYLDVKVERLEDESLDVRGESVMAQRYHITAKQMSLNVWYSRNDEWLALESVRVDGRLIRYELAG